jgi:two-component system chemotaxis response regulator CheY
VPAGGELGAELGGDEVVAGSFHVLEGERPEVIITEINMPNLDGFGFIEAVRADSAARATPILVLTPESDPEKKLRAREAGATGWIVKPFNPEKLVSAIRRVAA